VKPETDNGGSARCFRSARLPAKGIWYRGRAGSLEGQGIRQQRQSRWGYLSEGLSMEAFLDKGRFRSLLERIPVRVILKTETAAMLGAAYHAARILKSTAAA
jgi:hypothetical protein